MTTGVIAAHAVEASRLDDAALLDRIAADDAEIARLQARQLADLAEFARRPTRDPAWPATTWPRSRPTGRRSGTSPATPPTTRSRCGCAIGRRSADDRLRLACALARLPLTTCRAGRRADRPDPGAGRSPTRSPTSTRPPRARSRPASSNAAERLTAARLRARVKKAVHDADPVAADVRHDREQQRTPRHVEPAENGMAWLHAYLTRPRGPRRARPR